MSDGSPDKAVREVGGSTILTIRVSPGSKRSRVKGYNQWRDEWDVQDRSLPKKGEANAEVVQLMAGVLEVEPERLSISSGHRDVRKSVAVEGLSAEDVISKLEEGIR